MKIFIFGTTFPMYAKKKKFGRINHGMGASNSSCSPRWITHSESNRHRYDLIYFSLTAAARFGDEDSSTGPTSSQRRHVRQKMGQ